MAVPPWFIGDPKKFDPSKWQSPGLHEWSHPIATSLMLSRLNPDANIVVVVSDGGHDIVTSNACKFYGVKRVSYETLVNETPFRYSKKSNPAGFVNNHKNKNDDDDDNEEEKQQQDEKSSSVMTEAEGKSKTKKMDSTVTAATSPNM